MSTTDSHFSFENTLATNYEKQRRLLFVRLNDNHEAATMGSFIMFSLEELVFEIVVEGTMIFLGQTVPHSFHRQTQADQTTTYLE